MSSNTTDKKKWDLVVKPKVNLLSFNFKEIWAYKDLIILLMQRDIVTLYKQTLLGPIWIIIQPLMTTLMFTITFSTIAKMQTQGIPPFLYYLTSLTFWNYFADGVIKNANTFTANSAIFGKVYFPRLVMPISMMLSNLIKLGIQFFIFILLWLFFLLNNGGFNAHPIALILLPPIVLCLGLMGLSFGLIITSLTTKYRDFTFFIGYFVQFLMYASSIVIALPASGRVRDILMLNPIVPLIEYLKYTFLGVGYFSVPHLIYSLIFTIILFLFAVVIFNKTEKTFMDTV